MFTLTPAGVALCTTLLGTPTPSYDACETAISSSLPSTDLFWKSPVKQSACPDDMRETCMKEFKGYVCIEWGKYDIYDGSKGTNYFCHRDAKVIWLPDGRWSWSFD